MRKTRAIAAVVITTALLLFVLTVFSQKSTEVNTNTDIAGLKAAENDKQIVLQWDSMQSADIDYVELAIKGKNYDKTVKIQGDKTQYAFCEGEHGRKYDFQISVIYKDGSQGSKHSTQAMFMDYDSLPDMPMIRVNTITGEMPSCTYVASPEDCWGASITDNEYVVAEFVITGLSDSDIDCSGKIRIRGNTSAHYYDKKPYRIKLDKSVDMFNRGTEYKDTDWVLINYYENFATEVGFAVSEICDMEFTPGSVPVNLVINDKWQGLYILTEAVEKGKNRVNVSSSGFIIENDAYWWNEGDNYFKTDNDWYPLGYTFKYPDTDNVPQEIKNIIRNYVNDYENALLAEDVSYSDYIDIKSYASWLMVHDIMGTWDAGGSNMFMYKYDMNINNMFSSKMKMGPIWDLNSSYSKKDEWSSIHGDWALKYEIMFRMDDFKDTYKSQWQNVSAVLMQETEIFMDSYIEQYGEGLQQSFYLDSNRWGTKHSSVEEQKAFVLEWMKDRIEWMNNAVELI